MEHYDEESLSKLQKHLEGRLTKDDFIKSFEQVINLVLKVQKDQSEAITKLETTYGALMDKMRGDNSMSLSEMKTMMGKHFTEYTQKHTDIISQKIAGVKDGKDADEEKIIEKIFTQLKQRLPEIINNPEKLRDKLELLKEGEKLSVQSVQGLSKILEELKKDITTTGSRVGASLISKRIRFIDDETPTNSGDNINFTISKAPEDNSFKLYRGGARQRITEDYTLSGKNLALIVAKSANEILLCDFRY